MKSTALVSLDCVIGAVKRYLRVAGNKLRETGRVVVADWSPEKLDDPGIADGFLTWLRAFRVAYIPPEDDGPGPTSPLRTPKLARAA